MWEMSVDERSYHLLSDIAHKEDLEAALPDRLDDVILNLKKTDFVELLLNK